MPPTTSSAFTGQSSVTRIAASRSDCRDRDRSGRIETSSDVNGDGLIQTDCNVNGVEDDLADVRQAPCANGLAQEFYGLDDECVVWTTNTNSPNQYGRPLALGPGIKDDGGRSDVWAGTYTDGRFFRIDGTTGVISAQAAGSGTAAV